jgi:beta-galactosidase GanA
MIIKVISISNKSYLFWNEHEPYPGVYDFDGQNDIFKFIEIAQNKELSVIFRAGPYACGEHEYGSLPWWLLSNGTDSILPRSSERNYMNAVRRWLNVVLPKVKPYLYKNGGPIIMVQVLIINYDSENLNHTFIFCF